MSCSKTGTNDGEGIRFAFPVSFYRLTACRVSAPKTLAMPIMTVTVVKRMDFIRFFFKFIATSFSEPPTPSLKFLLLLEIRQVTPERQRATQ